MADPRYLAELARKKRASTGQLLFRCARLLNERALTKVRLETGVTTLRAAHTNLFPHLDFEGTRLTDLAVRLGISKQATFQLVEELEAQGVVEKREDPSDGRAKLVRFSKKGQVAILHGLRILAELERELASAIGKARFDALHEGLLLLLPLLETDAPQEPAPKRAAPDDGHQATRKEPKRRARPAGTSSAAKSKAPPNETVAKRQRR